MPIASENVPQRPTTFQNIVMAVHRTLDTVLTAEGRDAPELVFGQLQQGKFDRPPRVGWQQLFGSFANVPGVPPMPLVDGATGSRLGTRRIFAQASLWHVSPEQNEHMLERLWLASSRTIPEGAALLWCDRETKYAYPSEGVAEWLKNGCSVLVLGIMIDVGAPVDYDGETVPVALLDTQLRAGLEDVPDTTTPGQPEFVLNEWVG